MARPPHQGRARRPPAPARSPAAIPPLCALPEWTTDQSSYVIDSSAAVAANWYLGKGAATLPVQATFRRLFSVTPQATPQDAFDLGLPVDPVQAVNFTTKPGIPGPNGTNQQNFKTYLPPGCYERTLQPFSPFSTAFPPEIKPWPPDQSLEGVTDFDTTSEETLASGASLTNPTFDITRAEGLGGWTAFLRDIQTKRIFSNVVPLTGSLAQNVTLLTNHNPAPPSSEHQAATVRGAHGPRARPGPARRHSLAHGGVRARRRATLAGAAGSEEYPSLPTPVTVTGRIQTPAGTPVPANVYFTATDISDWSGQPFPPNFEFATSVSTTTDPAYRSVDVHCPFAAGRLYQSRSVPRIGERSPERLARRRGSGQHHDRRGHRRLAARLPVRDRQVADGRTSRRGRGRGGADAVRAGRVDGDLGEGSRIPPTRVYRAPCRRGRAPTVLRSLVEPRPVSASHSSSPRVALPWKIRRSSSARPTRDSDPL